MREKPNCPFLEEKGKIEVYGSLLRQLLAPLDALEPRERMIFLEHTFWQTGINDLAVCFKISQPRAYFLLTRAKTNLMASAPSLF